MAYSNRIYSDQGFSTKLLYNRNKPNIRKSKFSDYCNALCKESLITGFPVIASTKGFVRKIVKILVFILSTCGFLYQTSEFLKLYRAYPTMVDIKVENPDVVPLPAITICNKNRIRRKEYCLKRRYDCSWSNNRTQFCWANPKYCVPWQSDEETVFAIPKFDTMSHLSRTLEDLEMFGLKRSDLMEICMVIKETDTASCKNYLSIIASDENGFPNNCFVIESLWGKPDAEEEQIPITGKIAMMLKLKPEEYMGYFDLVLAHILMHDAYGIGNPMKEGLTLEAGMSHNIFVNKRITTRLPFPYKTNCTDYLKLWRQNGGHGPLTEKACEDKCKMEEMLKSLGCVGQSIAYPNNNSVCSDGREFQNFQYIFLLRLL
ncbi:uncharacterized protein TNCV_2787971 [Trichonephila clavipes]|uniref:Uncharacterized protein n=1 Tax=Trichonephila clavipes TaxID=2585209 RepID=A0A8X6VPU9_TRICX|nr:uncharacterized protein TNCV_2787971 [Trichonephila clavipes]